MNPLAIAAIIAAGYAVTRKRDGVNPVSKKAAKKRKGKRIIKGRYETVSHPRWSIESEVERLNQNKKDQKNSIQICEGCDDGPELVKKHVLRHIVMLSKDPHQDVPGMDEEWRDEIADLGLRIARRRHWFGGGVSFRIEILDLAWKTTRMGRVMYEFQIDFTPDQWSRVERGTPSFKRMRDALLEEKGKFGYEGGERHVAGSHIRMTISGGALVRELRRWESDDEDEESIVLRTGNEDARAQKAYEDAIEQHGTHSEEVGRTQAVKFKIFDARDLFDKICEVLFGVHSDPFAFIQANGASVFHYDSRYKRFTDLGATKL